MTLIKNEQKIIKAINQIPEYKFVHPKSRKAIKNLSEFFNELRDDQLRSNSYYQQSALDYLFLAIHNALQFIGSSRIGMTSLEDGVDTSLGRDTLINIVKESSKWLHDPLVVFPKYYSLGVMSKRKCEYVINKKIIITLKLIENIA